MNTASNNTSPREIALRAAFFMDGLHSAGIDLSAWDKGYIEMVDELVSYVPFVNKLIDRSQEIVANNFPGVFDYEVSVQFGKWFGDHITKSNGETPSRQDAEKWLTGEVIAFFSQGIEPGDQQRMIAALSGQELQPQISFDDKYIDDLMDQDGVSVEDGVNRLYCLKGSDFCGYLGNSIWLINDEQYDSNDVRALLKTHPWYKRPSPQLDPANFKLGVSNNPFGWIYAETGEGTGIRVTGEMIKGAYLGHSDDPQIDLGKIKGTPGVAQDFFINEHDVALFCNKDTASRLLGRWFDVGMSKPKPKMR